MCDRDDFDFGLGLTKYDNVRKASKHHPADVECELRKLLRSLLNALQRGAKFGHQSTRCVRAALPIPFNSGFGFVLRLRVNPDRLHLEGTLAQRRRSASSQGSIATGPASISRKRCLMPSLLGAFIYLTVDALEQRIGKGCASLRWE